MLIRVKINRQNNINNNNSHYNNILLNHKWDGQILLLMKFNNCHKSRWHHHRRFWDNQIEDNSNQTENYNNQIEDNSKQIEIIDRYSRW